MTILGYVIGFIVFSWVIAGLVICYNHLYVKFWQWRYKHANKN